MNTRRIALLSVITSLCVGIQITPRPPNIEFTSLICFMTGFVFGSKFGAFLGALTMFINGFLSPWGFAGLIMPFQVVGMLIIGFVGGIYNGSLKGNPYSSHLTCVEVAVLAAFLTLIYEFIANVGFAVLCMDANIVAASIMGAWFTITHVGSNTIFFGSTFVPLAKIVKRLEGGEAFC